jgi:tripartite-type tricarboxylate transporter receptor subunit TctC
MNRFLNAVVLGISLAFASVSACAQYPARPIRFIVPLAAGGPLDSVARVVGKVLSQTLGQPVLIENKSGADGAIAAEAVLNAPPDGHTLLWGNANTMVGVPLLRKDPPYDPGSFTPVSFIARPTLFLYSYPGIPAKTVSELVGYSRANPGKLNYATSTFSDVVAAAQFMKAAGINMTRIPYKGAAQAIPDLVAGRVQVAIAPAFPALTHAKEGKLRALAVFLAQRSPAAPEVPAIAEAGISGVSVPWIGVFGPPRMPREIVERLSGELNLVLKQPEVLMQFERLAFLGEGSTPQTLAAHLKEELEKSKQIVREYGITQE